MPKAWLDRPKTSHLANLKEPVSVTVDILKNYQQSSNHQCIIVCRSRKSSKTSATWCLTTLPVTTGIGRHVLVYFAPLLGHARLSTKLLLMAFGRFKYLSSQFWRHCLLMHGANHECRDPWNPLSSTPTLVSYTRNFVVAKVMMVELYDIQFITQPLVASNWERFEFYAKWIRLLELSPDYSIDKGVLCAFELLIHNLGHPYHLLENLQEVVCNTHGRPLWTVSLFLGPKLLQFTLHIEGWIGFKDFPWAHSWCSIRATGIIVATY